MPPALVALLLALGCAGSQYATPGGEPFAVWVCPPPAPAEAPPASPPAAPEAPSEERPA